MSSFLLSSDKENIRDLFSRLHDTFARPITWFKKPREVIISTNSSHNSFFEDGSENTQVSLITESGTMNARILYGQKMELGNLQLTNPSNISNNVVLGQGEVRIKIPASGALLFEDVDRIHVDGIPYQKDTNKRRIGMFEDAQFYSIYLKEID